MNKEMLDLYTDYLISQNSHATATGLSELTDNDIKHDKVTRFLRTENFTSKDLWSYNKKDIRQIEQSTGGVISLDDTIEEKTYTDENDIVCWHYSHAKGRHVKGVNILSCIVTYADISMPIAYEAVKKDILYSEIKTQKTKRKSSVTKNHLFRNLITQTIDNDISFDYITADVWFGAKDNMIFAHNLNKKFIFGIKANRLVDVIKNDERSGQFQQAKFLLWKDGDCKRVCLKGLQIPVLLLKKVFINEDGTNGTLYLVTNDLTIDANRIYEVYQKRWQIEKFHQSIKQNTSLEKSPTKIIRTQLNHIFCSMIAYCKLERLKIKTNLNHFAIKHKLILRANQAAIKELRRLRQCA